MTYDMLDQAGSSDAGGFDAKQNRSNLDTPQLVHGFVTIIKNEGREDEQILCKNKHNVLTNDGRDEMHVALYTNNGAPAQNAYNYIALSTNAGGADPTHTTLAGEITTGGLQRAQASTLSHSTGSNTSTVAHTFTASATHTAVQLSGLFDAASVGTMGHENTFTPASLESADTLTVTWTLTLG